VRIVGALVLLAAALAFAAAAPASAAEPLRICVSLGPEGRYKGPSEMQRRAYGLWQVEINGRGGLLGRPVEIEFGDDKGSADEAERIYRGFVRGGKCDLVFGPYSSALTARVAPIVDGAGFPMLAAGASADEIWQQGYRNVFGMWTPASRYSQGMLRMGYMAGLRKIAILHADDEFSSAIAGGTRRWAPYLELEIVTDESFAKGTADLADYVRRARDAGAELVVVAGHRNEAVNARRAMAALGWIPRAFFATVGPALPGWSADMGPDAEGAFATSIWEPHRSVNYPGAHDFANAFRGEYRNDPSYHAATAYAAGQILEAAVAQAQSLDRDDIRAALFDLDTESVIGRYAVDHTGMQVKRLEMIVQWQNGRKEIVWQGGKSPTPPVFGETGT
jgi:branched-chain amino acid transport system substrate-binding protein